MALKLLCLNVLLFKVDYCNVKNILWCILASEQRNVTHKLLPALST